MAAAGLSAAKLRPGGLNMMTGRRKGGLTRLARPDALVEENRYAAEHSRQHNRRYRPHGSDHVLDSSADAGRRFA
jgi:hypothetical protein